MELELKKMHNMLELIMTSQQNFRHEVFNRFDKVDQEISDLRANMDDFRSQMNRMDSEITGIKTEITGIKTEVAGIQTEVAGIQTEVAGIKTEVTGIKTEMAGIQTEIAGIQSHLARVDNEIAGIHLHLSNVDGDMLGMRTYMEGEFSGIRSQLNRMEFDSHQDVMAMLELMDNKLENTATKDDISFLAGKLGQHDLEIDRLKRVK